MLVLWILFLLAMSVIGLIGFAAFSNKKAKDLLPPVGTFAQLGGTACTMWIKAKGQSL